VASARYGGAGGMIGATLLGGTFDVKLPFIDRIWCVRGGLPLDAAQSPGQVFGKLDALFHERGTTYAVAGDTLTFSKKAPPAQDKMATFDHGFLRVVEGEGGTTLIYELSSKTLLFCFALPFFFAALAWIIVDSRTTAFVFSGIFTFLYIVGRILEPWLVRSVFQKHLSEPSLVGRETPFA